MTGLSRLYRAIVTSALRDREAVVFFEAPVHRERLDHVEQLMSVVWDVPAHDIEAYNVHSAEELLERGFGDAETGDLRLFETGWSEGRPLYADPAQTLLLVGSQALYLRLYYAQLLAPVRPAELLAAA